MIYDNVKLWFAKDTNKNIVTIDEINENNKSNYYSCPVCGSKVNPKAIASKYITPHFAHVDASKCNAETMMHWWFKNKFLEQGDSFIVVSDKERRYVCKEVLVEQSYCVGKKLYKPDITIITECEKTIYFEMDYSNKKNVKDYLDTWLELGNMVVEVDIKKFMSKDKILVFNALFYKNKCFNTNKNDLYFNTIGKYKEKKYENYVDSYLKVKLQQLDWFWDDVLRYKNNEVDIYYMVDLIDSFEDEGKEIVLEILNKPKCIDILQHYFEEKCNLVYTQLKDYAIECFGKDYDNCFKKRIEIDSYSKKLQGSILCKDLDDDCFSVYDVHENNIVNSLNKLLSNNIKIIYQKKIESLWKEKTDDIISLISNNENMIKLISNLKEKQYKLNIWFSYIDKTKYILRAQLVYRDMITAENYSLEIFESTSIQEIVDYLINQINIYFSKLDKFNYTSQLNDLINYLNAEFNYIAKFNGYLWLEDIYNISIKNSSNISSSYGNFELDFYFNNSGIKKGCRDNEIILQTSDINIIKTFLIDKMRERIKETMTVCCVDCLAPFILNEQEIKFFNSKNLYFPKRCKKCRQNKRQTRRA